MISLSMTTRVLDQLRSSERFKPALMLELVFVEPPINAHLSAVLDQRFFLGFFHSPLFSQMENFDGYFEATNRPTRLEREGNQK